MTQPEEGPLEASVAVQIQTLLASHQKQLSDAGIHVGEVLQYVNRFLLYEELRGLGYNIYRNASLYYDTFAPLSFREWRTSHSISWSDTGEQPRFGEKLLVIEFPTGAYVFGEIYLPELFNEFFEELKTYGPRYSDSQNHSLYFKIEGSASLFNQFFEILGRYRAKYKPHAKAQRQAKLIEELNNLKNEENQ